MGVFVENCDGKRDKENREIFRLVIHATDMDGNKISNNDFLETIVSRLTNLVGRSNCQQSVAPTQSVTASSKTASQVGEVQQLIQFEKPLMTSASTSPPSTVQTHKSLGGSNIGRLWRLAMQLARLKGTNDVNNKVTAVNVLSDSLDRSPASPSFERRSKSELIRGQWYDVISKAAHDKQLQPTSAEDTTDQSETENQVPNQPVFSPFGEPGMQDTGFEARSASLPQPLYGPVVSPFSTGVSEDDEDEEDEEQQEQENPIQLLGKKIDEGECEGQSSSLDSAQYTIRGLNSGGVTCISSMSPKSLPLVQDLSGVIDEAGENSTESASSQESIEERSVEWSVLVNAKSKDSEPLVGSGLVSLAQEDYQTKSKSMPATKSPNVTKVEQIMSKPVLTIHQNADWHEAILKMKQYSVSTLLVETDEPEKGFITKRTLIRLWSTLTKKQRPAQVKDVMVTPVEYVKVGTTLDEVSLAIERLQIRRILVRDEEGKYVGIVSDTDIFRALGDIYDTGGKKGPSSDVSRLSDRYLSIDFRSKAASFWEVDINQVNFVSKIGQGSYGEVWMGKWRGIEVAVKRLFTTTEESKEDFEREVGYMAMVRHPNIVQFLGVSHMGGIRAEGQHPRQVRDSLVFC
eukprot:TRINITY_DN4155_c1_g1_i4.p1 TRINITY_DN4155_c1_g1~~TRINITY_DN4155_c1_g1_i4.p1  ORF type:complete len:738 (-),score=90.43 TRINITY_DN4155_c1_g1_i4:44-1933(-)